MRAPPRRQSGQIIVLVALSMVVLVSAVALALDAGLSYTVKAKLNAATDSASLAAARAVSQGNDQAAQTANAKAAARRFFDANFPSGYMLSTATMNEPVVTFDRGKVIVDISASASMPVSLMGVVNGNPLAPGAVTRTERKDLDMAVVLDTSGSLSNSAANVRSSAITFLEKFNTSQDRVGLMRFAYGSVVDDPIKKTGRGFDRPAMIEHIKNYEFSGSTASAEGMWAARNQLNSVAGIDRSSLRVIVFFSDGSPNSFGSYFPFKVSAECALPGVITTNDDTSADYPGGLNYLDQMAQELPGLCSPDDRDDHVTSHIEKLPDWYNAHNGVLNPNDPTKREFPIVTSSPRVVTNDVSSKTAAWRNVNRAARNLAEAMASKSRDEGIYVFTLGLGAQLKSGTGPDSEKGEDVLKCMANTPDAPSRCFNAAKPVGVYCYAATTSDLTPCFSKLASAILRISK